MLYVYALVTFLVLATPSCSHRSPNGRGCLLLQNRSIACSLFHLFQENRSQTTVYPAAMKRLFMQAAQPVHIPPSALWVSCLLPPLLSCSLPTAAVTLGGVTPCTASASSPKFSSLVALLLFSSFSNYRASQISISSSHPSISYNSSDPFALQKTAQPLVATRGFFSFFSNTLFFPPLSPVLTIHPSTGLLLEKFWYMALKKKKNERKEKCLFPFQTNLIIHTACLLFLCSCLRFLRVLWNYRLYPICMTLFLRYAGFSKFLIV